MSAKTEATASPRAAARQLGEDIGVIQAQLIIKVLLHPSASDAAMVDSWRRLVGGLASGYDPSPHFERAFAQRDDGTGETP